MLPPRIQNARECSKMFWGVAHGGRTRYCEWRSEGRAERRDTESIASPLSAITFVTATNQPRHLPFPSYIYLSIYVSIHLSIYPYPSIYLLFSISIYLSTPSRSPARCQRSPSLLRPREIFIELMRLDRTQREGSQGRIDGA